MHLLVKEELFKLVSTRTVPFIVGCFVIGLACSWLFYSLPVGSINIGHYFQVFHPEPNQQTTKILRSLASKNYQLNSTIVPTQSLQIAESGQISAISSGQVTYKENVYIVQPGDSLESIAEQVYGDSKAWKRIAEINHLESPDAIETGMKLTIKR